MVVVGMMSGTSLDGIDAAVVRISGTSLAEVQWEMLGFVSQPYTPDQRARILGAIDQGSAGRIAALHVDVGEWFAGLAKQAIQEAGLSPDQVDAIASHGQTIWHIPPGAPESERFGLEGDRGASLQIGDPATIAERTGIDVVSDLRARDLAAQGHGAPVVPWLDWLLFRREAGRRCMQNLGGIGNVTWLPPLGEREEPLAFDTGPANCLMDAAVQWASGGEQAYDRDGEMGRRGTVHSWIVEEVMALPYFDEAPPKSTGRELFSPAMVQGFAGRLSGEREEVGADLVATFAEVTAQSVGDSYRRWLPSGGIEDVVVTGGGARNPFLLDRLADALDPIPVKTGEALGVDPDAKEALAFAMLGWAFRHGVAGNLPSVTGATHHVVMGSLTPGSSPRTMPS